MTQPTLLDLYKDEEFLTTPGVKEGLLQSAKPGAPDFRIFDRKNGQEGVYYISRSGMQYFVGDRPRAMPPEVDPNTQQPGFGQTSPSRFLRGTMETSATIAKGTAQSVGVFGDIESGFRGLLNNLDQPAMQRIQASPSPFLRTFFELVQSGVDFDKFLEGMEQETFLPTVKDVGEAIDKTGVMPQRQVMEEGAVGAAELMGELLAPTGYIQGAKKVGRGVRSGVQKIKKAVTKPTPDNTIPPNSAGSN